MSEFQMAYVAMVVLGMATFLVVLAWGCWFTRPPKARPGQDTPIAVEVRI